MGGATVPTPGGGTGAMAFPSASEPNPILKGLRGAGPEQVINQINPPSSPTSPSSPASPATSPTAPFTGAELFQLTNPSGPQYGSLLYSLQGGTGQLLPGLAQGAGTLNQATPSELAAYGYTDISQVPQLPNGNNLYTNAQYQYGTGQPGTLFGPMTSFSYNQQAAPFQSYQPTYNPYSGAVFNTSPTALGSSTLFNYLPTNAYNQLSGGLNSSWIGQNMLPYGQKPTSGS